MKYDPIKKTLGRFFSGSLFMRKCLYFMLDLLLLRTWHVKRALRMVSANYSGDMAILDAGCGFGQYTWRMSRINSFSRIKAVDIDREHIADCSAFFQNSGMSDRITLETLDLTKLSETSCYDLILSVDVMEHIEEDEKVFRNFCNALRENGSLIISTPSDKGGSDVHSENEDSFIGEHVRDGYSMKDITEKLTRAGFRKINVTYTYGLPGTISWRLSMKYPIKMLNTSYLFFIVLPFWYLIFFPVSLILNYFDLIISHKEGTGLLVIARK
jgi:SAM-dependent methyltransferase